MWKNSLLGLFLVVFMVAGIQKKGLAQDPQFTQFYANPLYLNPAFAGSRKCPRLNINYRNQWPNIPGQFITTSASYDQHVDGISGGLGGIVYQDNAGNGTLSTTYIGAMYSYTLPVNREFSLKFGLEAAYMEKKVDWSQLTFGDMIDPRYGFIYETQETPGPPKINNADFSVGVLGYSKVYYFGAAVHHLTEPEETFFNDPQAKLYRKYTIHAGANFVFNERSPEDGSISPNILYKRQGQAQQMNVGMYLKKGPFVGGLWYRLGDSFIALVGLQTDNFKFGYSYDLTTSALTTEPGGSHEISLAMLFPCRRRPKVFRPLVCPEF
jgi:type IX secretion system PorP/SprF family membrane protein